MKRIAILLMVVGVSAMAEEPGVEYRVAVIPAEFFQQCDAMGKVMLTIGMAQAVYHVNVLHDGEDPEWAAVELKDLQWMCTWMTSTLMLDEAAGEEQLFALFMRAHEAWKEARGS